MAKCLDVLVPFIAVSGIPTLLTKCIRLVLSPRATYTFVRCRCVFLKGEIAQCAQVALN